LIAWVALATLGLAVGFDSSRGAFDIPAMVAVGASAIASGTSILYPTLGEILAERSGVLNLGVEGMMLMGALGGYAVAFNSGSLWAGVAAAMVAGGVLSLIHAFLSVSLRANQVVSGLALTIFGGGLTTFLGKPYIGRTVNGFTPVHVPVLSDIPILGGVFFHQDVLVLASYLVAPALWFYIYRTRPGLHLRATGENPVTADAMGVRVALQRYGYTFAGGCLAGLGGAYLSLAYTPSWVQGMTAGRGWIAIALVIFAAWDPLRAMGGAYLFGAVDAFQFHLQSLGAAVSSFVLTMSPYVITIAFLVIASRENLRQRLGGPAALGLPFVREERN
jgi:simple sugar transport system permease protein